MARVVRMDRPVQTVGVRVLLLQTLAHALIFAAQNAGTLTERALLAPDTAATAAVGLSWTAFCVVSAFTTNVVNVGQLVVGRRAGDGDEHGAQAAARQALVLAGGGGAVGLVLAVAAGTAAAFAAGPARDAALFLAAQGLALGPLLAAQALTGYFTGTMRIGLPLLMAVSVLPIVIHLGLGWLLIGLLAWSVAGAGVARLGAALALVPATLAVARTELRSLMGSARSSDRALLRAMFAEGCVLGLQQVAASFMVLLLYVRVAGAGEVPSAALTLTHAGVYPLLFALAWGSSQAVGAAAAQAVGRGDARELIRVTWLGLGLSAVLAFAVPWGAYVLCGKAALAWLVEGNPSGDAVLAVSVRLMGALALFFVFDFGINFLSALLRAAKDQAYLLKTTAAVAAGFGSLVVALPLPADGACLLGTFITAQAVWAAVLLVRVVARWPVAVKPDLLAGSCAALASVGNSTRCAIGSAPSADNSVLRPGLSKADNLLGRAERDPQVGREEGADHPVNRVEGQGSKDTRRRKPTGPLMFRPACLSEEFQPWSKAMKSLDPNTGPLPPTLRALALGLLVEAVVPVLARSAGASPVPPDQAQKGADATTELWQELRGKCDELSALVLRADNPEEAAAYVLDYLPNYFDYLFEVLYGQRRGRVLEPVRMVCHNSQRNGRHDTAPA
jgi:Na+-driven multidrug efflux pump